MTETVIAGTDGGLIWVGQRPGAALDKPVGHLASSPEGLWAVTEGARIRQQGPDGWEEGARLDDLRANVVLPIGEARALIGTSEARLLRLDDGGLEPVPGFDEADGRDRWFTPWGGPPDVRSLAAGPDGTLYANVHVGGVLRSTDGGATWEPTSLDIETDVHQVLADPRKPGTVLAASAFGLAVSGDAGNSWTVHDEGLHATYCRAVAIADDGALVTASRGPRGGRAGIYRFRGGRFERSRDGLPEWFDGNIDTHCLDAHGSIAAFGTAEGAVFLSRDAGTSWDRVVEGLQPIRSVLLPS